MVRGESFCPSILLQALTQRLFAQAQEILERDHGVSAAGINKARGPDGTSKRSQARDRTTKREALVEGGELRLAHLFQVRPGF